MRHLEDTLQKQCVRWFSLQYREYAKLLHHSPNGGKRNAIEAAKFKAMGTKAGFPDLELCIARHGFNALFIELKAPKGVQSKPQKEMECALKEQGYEYVIVRSFEDFVTTINNYLAE